MNQSPEDLVEVVQRLDSIASTLEKLSGDNADALKAYRDSDERYRKELEAYSAERATTNPALLIGLVLRAAAVILLAYIALKIS
jgi:hypothetical protein